MASSVSAGLYGFLAGVGFFLAILIGVILAFFLLKWWVGTIDLKDLIIKGILR